MSKMETKVKFEVKKNELWAKVEHSHIVTAEEEYWIKLIYQFKRQNEKGIRVPLDETKVSPIAGECITTTTFFRFSSDISIGARYAISKLPLNVLRFVIETLEKHIRSEVFSVSDIIVARKALRALKTHFT